MTRASILATLTAALMLTVAARPAAADSFARVGTFHVTDNLPAGVDPAAETAAEIVTVSADGMTLIYTDSPGKRIGFVDITDPARPKAAGVLAVGGEPTSAVVAGGKAYVVVNSSPSFTAPSGHLAIVDIAKRTIVATCDIGGQPDSIAKSPDGSFLAIAVENERDETVNKGDIPQLPSGFLASFRIKDDSVDCASKAVVPLAGLALIAPEDAEPEFVDINSKNQAAVTLQENNHIVIVDLPTSKVIGHFSAGTVTLEGIDSKRDGVIAFDGRKADVPREPDTIQWIGDDRILVANEGDWKGGSRGFSIFSPEGKLLHDSGRELEMLTARLGHFPEKRASAKGAEPEGAEVGVFGGTTYLFVATERASLTAVYRDTGGKPEYLQALPGGVAPEGLLAIPARGLFVTANEADGRKDGLSGSTITIHRLGPGAPTYPEIQSADDAAGNPIAWGALSGLAADPRLPGRLFAVTDSAYATARILTVDATKTPALITAATTVTRDGKPVAGLDIEGIAIAADGNFWLASEGNPEREKDKTQSQIARVAPDGRLLELIDLPETLQAAATRFGFEGVAVTGSGADETVWLAVQREWKDDPKGFTKILAYRPATKTWGAVRYPLSKPDGGWVGLSELTAVPGGFVVIERDNLVGPAAKLKTLYRITLDGVTPGAIGDKDLPVVKKTLAKDLLPLMAAGGGYVVDKIESFTIDAAGDGFAVTDNDGVDGTNGETRFLRLGKF